MNRFVKECEKYIKERTATFHLIKYAMMYSGFGSSPSTLLLLALIGNVEWPTLVDDIIHLDVIQSNNDPTGFPIALAESQRTIRPDQFDTLKQNGTSAVAYRFGNKCYLKTVVCHTYAGIEYRERIITRKDGKITVEEI